MFSTDSPEMDSNTQRSWFGKGWYVICALMLILAGLSRLLFLDEKPFHHDESLHAYYSHRVAQGFPHEYTALLHGPVLYYLVGVFMMVFGVNDLTARLPAALCSVALVMLPLLWRKRIGSAAALAISVFLLLSPTFMYFGRFLREDAFNSLWIACSLAAFFGYRWTGRAWMAVCCSAFLALQFCNKENSYLHVFVWLTGASAIEFLRHMKLKANDMYQTAVAVPQLATAEKIAMWVNCVLVFAVIYVLFYSSFFRHSKGSLNGILDGLYRESLLYWWDQNQKRRIDGPFDYHSPLFFNYEFALVPALVAAWWRATRLASLRWANTPSGFPFSLVARFRRVAIVAVVLMVLVLVVPRIGLTPDGCNIAGVCLKSMLPGLFSDTLEALARLLHLSHTRHLFQLIATVVLGAIAVLATVSLGRKLDAFLWWWATGAIGIYSYVGEKVPWLLIYILLPLIALAGLEAGRSLHVDSLWIDSFKYPRSGENRDSMKRWEGLWQARAGRIVLGLTAVCLAFASWKSIQLSFVRPADPIERLVFTQSTPAVALVRERWSGLSKQLGKTPRITMHGDSTWPFAWYVHDLPGHDFIKPVNAQAASGFDAMLLDNSDLEFARENFPFFDIYKIPLRHWWVPQANPKLNEIFDYFLTSRPYPRELRGSPQSFGIGDTPVLYLENRGEGRFFEFAQPPEGFELVASAARAGQTERPSSEGTPLNAEPVRSH